MLNNFYWAVETKYTQNNSRLEEKKKKIYYKVTLQCSEKYGKKTKKKSYISPSQVSAVLMSMTAGLYCYSDTESWEYYCLLDFF